MEKSVIDVVLDAQRGGRSVTVMGRGWFLHPEQFKARGGSYDKTRMKDWHIANLNAAQCLDAEIRSGHVDVVVLVNLPNVREPASEKQVKRASYGHKGMRRITGKTKIVTVRCDAPLRVCGTGF